MYRDTLVLVVVPNATSHPNDFATTMHQIQMMMLMFVLKIIPKVVLKKIRLMIAKNKKIA